MIVGEHSEAIQGLIDPLSYKLVVFDLDGTLYRQAPVRRAMLMELLRDGAEPGRFARLTILYHFRKIREDLADETPLDFEGPLFSRLASKTGLPKPFLTSLVEEWMETRPLVHLRAAAVPGALDFIKTLRRQGVAVAVWSDYPVQAKLQALDIEVDLMLSASDKNINALKPNPTGLHRAMEIAGVEPATTLMVGDRLLRDGTAAAAANVDFLLRHDKTPRALGDRQFHIRDFNVFQLLDPQSSKGGLAVQNC